MNLYCSFCGKTALEVVLLIAGPCVYICNECLAVCVYAALDNGVDPVSGEPLDDPADDTWLGSGEAW